MINRDGIYEVLNSFSGRLLDMDGKGESKDSRGNFSIAGLLVDRAIGGDLTQRGLEIAIEDNPKMLEEYYGLGLLDILGMAYMAKHSTPPIQLMAVWDFVKSLGDMCPDCQSHHL